MFHDQALRIAIEAIRKVKKGVAVDANIYKRYGGDGTYPRAKKAYVKYCEYEEAINTLVGLRKVLK